MTSFDQRLFRQKRNVNFTITAVVSCTRLDYRKHTAFIQYKPVECFEHFAKKVAGARRKADANTDDADVGNTAKLIGMLKYKFLLICQKASFEKCFS